MGNKMKTIKILSILLLLPTISFSQIQYGGAPIAEIGRASCRERV